MAVRKGIEGRLLDLYCELGEKSLDIMLFFRTDGPILHANPVAVAAYGYTYDELCQLNFSDLRAEDTRSEIPQQIEMVRAASFRFETVHRRKDGSGFPVESTWSLTEGYGAEVVLAVVRDITDKKAVENALRKSERELSDFFDNASVGLHWVAADGTIVRANQAELDLLGYTADEYVGHNITDFHADAETIDDILNCLTRGEKIYDRRARLRHKNGSIRHVLISSSVYFEEGQFRHTRCFTSDITDRVAAEEALVQSELRWKTVTETLPNLVWTDLPNGQCDWLSSQWEEFTGIPVPELLGLNWIEKVLHPDDRERTLQAWNDACAGIADYDLEYRIRRHDGEYHWFKTRGVPVKNENGKIIYWFGTCTDIEDIRRAEASHLETERTLRAFYDNSPVFMGITEVIGDDVFHIYDNPSTCAFFGVPPNATANKFALADIGADPNVVSIWIENYREAERTGKPVQFEHAHNAKLGQRWLSVTVSVLGKTDSGRTRFCYVGEDVTERVVARESLRDSEERYRILVQHSANIMWRTGSDGKYIGPQESFERFTGLTYDEYKDDGGLRAVHPDDVDHVIQGWQTALETPEAFELEYRLKNRDGEYRHTFTRGVPLLDRDGCVKEWVGYAEDITERKAAEDQRIALLHLEEQARREAEILNDLARTLASTLDLESLVQQVTDAATSLTGAQFGAFFYNLLDSKGESYTLYTLSGVPRSAFENFPMPRNTPIFGPTFSGTGVMRLDDVTKDPRYGTMPPYHGMPKGHLPVRSYLAAPVISRSGEVLGGLFFGHSEAGVFKENHERMVIGLAAHTAVAMDNARLFSQAQDEIARRKQVEFDLRTSQQHLQLTTEAAQVGTWEWHLAENSLIWSPIHKKLWGYNVDEPLLFGDWSRLIDPTDLEAAEGSIDDCLSGNSETYDIEYRIMPVGSSEFRWMRSIGQPVAGDDGKVSMMRGVTYDITAERLARQELSDARDLLEIKVRERTAQLSELTSELQQEVSDRSAAEAQVRHFLSRLVDIQEEERHRIARNIHDDLGQHLTAFRINLRSLTNEIEGDLSKQANLVEQIAEELDSRIDAVTWELRPVDLENAGLIKAFENLVTSWSSRFNIPAEFSSIGRSDIDLPLETGVHLYRIMQEGLHNVAKHSNASHAVVMVEITDDLFKLIIEDDGRGFNPSNGTVSKRDRATLGLISMRERATLINGTIEIESSKGSGTTIFVRLPINQ